ncbi:MAG TPA: calcium-binding protein [Allosphingosinicella sp.]|jgi:Ca2+-binding RTX toxin-like protein
MATFNGTSIDDTYTGGSANDTINGFGGNDTLSGGGGADRIDGGTGTDTMAGGTGNDIFTVDNVGDIVIEYADEGRDQVKTSLTSYTIPDHVEKLLFTTTAAVIGTGNAENNEIMTAAGGSATDYLYGLDGYDTLWGGGGADYLYGGNHDDILIGEGGADYMEGNTGDDGYMVDSLSDVVFEQSGEGIDVIYSALATYTLPAEVEDLRYNSFGTNFNFTGNDIDNKIYGGGGNDTLSGLEGNDELRGEAGADTLYGGDGDDLLIGGGGASADTLTGGASADTFRIGFYESGTGSGADRITDFESGIDLIDVSAWDADNTQPDDQSFFFIDDAPFDSTPGRLRYEYDSNTDTTVIQGDLNGDNTADFEIRLDGYIMLASNDFLL